MFPANKTGADRFIGVASPQMTWTNAQTYCRTFYTDLASTLDQTDNNLLAKVQGDSWIGLFRDTWKWSDGTIPAKNEPRWALGQPDNHNNKENCGTVYGKDFADELCTDLNYCICYNGKSFVKLHGIYTTSVTFPP